MSPQPGAKPSRAEHARERGPRRVLGQRLDRDDRPPERRAQRRRRREPPLEEHLLPVDRVEPEELVERRVALLRVAEHPARELPVQEREALSDGARLRELREFPAERAEVDLEDPVVAGPRSDEGLLEPEKLRDRSLLRNEPFAVDADVAPAAERLAEREVEPGVADLGLLRGAREVRERRRVEIDLVVRPPDLLVSLPQVRVEEARAAAGRVALEEEEERLAPLGGEGRQLLDHGATSAATADANP